MPLLCDLLIIEGRDEVLSGVLIIFQVVDKNSDEANIIMQYVKNTHAATHNTYTLEVQEVSSRRHRPDLHTVISTVSFLNTNILLCLPFFPTHTQDLQNWAAG